MWSNGITTNAVILNVYGTNTFLNQNAFFVWELKDANKSNLASGQIEMDNAAYELWGDDDDYVWDWAAEQLNLTITGDYVEPEIIEEI